MGGSRKKKRGMHIFPLADDSPTAFEDLNNESPGVGDNTGVVDANLTFTTGQESTTEATTTTTATPAIAAAPTALDPATAEEEQEEEKSSEIGPTPTFRCVSVAEEMASEMGLGVRRGSSTFIRQKYMG